MTSKLLVFLLGFLITACSSEDKFYVYTDISSKIEIPCPNQNVSTAVLFTFGQSNSANYSEIKHSNSDTRIVNYFGGRCYVASDPILGSMGSRGSVWIPMAKKLLDDGAYSRVIIAGAGIGGVSVEQINQDEEAHTIVTNALNSVSQHYDITDFLYHQGESNKHSTEEQYKSGLETLITWTSVYSPSARFFVSVASICNSEPYIQVQNAQRAVVDNVSVFQGPDTDSLVPLSLRYDNCHFGSNAQNIVGEEWASLIK